MSIDHPEQIHKRTDLQHGSAHDVVSRGSEGRHGASAEINLLNLQKPDPSVVERHIIDALKKDSGNLQGIYQELGSLKSAESASKFSQDLLQINSDLHKNGLLPDLEIVLDKDAKDGFSVKQRKADDNAKPIPEPEIIKPEPRDQNHPRHEDGRKIDHGKDHSGEGRHHSRHSGGAHHGHGRHHGHGHRRHHVGRIAHGGKHHHFEDGAYDGVKAPDEATLAESVKTVLSEAKSAGLSEKATKAALASMLVESKGNPQARGDGNTSFGLFQLHRGGELTEALRHGLLKNENEAFNPAKNAHVALAYFKQHEGSISDPGKLAAASQRPKHRGEYADKVNELLNNGTIDNLIKKYGAGS